MEKRILCYTDFSKNALNAIQYTSKLYEQQPCVFYILNAFQAGKDASDIEALIPETDNETYILDKKTSEAGLKTIIDILNSTSKRTKHTYKTISSFNSLLFSLKDTIKNNAIDLLVLGSENTFKEEEDENVPLVDITEYITECSILIVPGDHKFNGLDKIVLPIDYDEALNETNFSEILTIAKLHQSEVNILHIKKEHQLDEDQLENKNKLASILVGLKYNFHTLKRMNVNKGINLFIEDDTYSLIVFIKGKVGFISNELPRPLLKELDSHLSLPVLVINDISLVEN